MVIHQSGSLFLQVFLRELSWVLFSSWLLLMTCHQESHPRSDSSQRTVWCTDPFVMDRYIKQSVAHRRLIKSHGRLCIQRSSFITLSWIHVLLAPLYISTISSSVTVQHMHDASPLALHPDLLDPADYRRRRRRRRASPSCWYRQRRDQFSGNIPKFGVGVCKFRVL